MRSAEEGPDDEAQREEGPDEEELDSDFDEPARLNELLRRKIEVETGSAYEPTRKATSAWLLKLFEDALKRQEGVRYRCLVEDGLRMMLTPKVGGLDALEEYLGKQKA
jgi:hypothetical protein